MKAIVLTAYGDVDKLELRDVPEPPLDRDAIVVRMAAAGINPIDWKIRSGASKARFPVKFPAILGRDASGTVVRVGSGVTSFAPGDHVMGLVQGAYAELVVAPAQSWARVPPGLDLVEAGALPLVLLTGAQLVEEAVNPEARAIVLVTGAVGSVGRTAVHAATSRGARVWAGVRGSQRFEAAKLGVEGIVALDDERSIAQLPTLDAIADTVNGAAITRLYGKLKPEGTIGSVLGEPAGAKEHGFVVRAFAARADGAMLARYAQAVSDRKLVIPIAKTYPLARAAEAQKFAESGDAHGKVVLVAAPPT
jgi:NADPH:quinone reductase-like Zn-dependent oxidoreductase